MTVKCEVVGKNIFGFDLDYLPQTCKIYPTFTVKNYALNSVYVRIVKLNGRFDFNGQDYSNLGAVNGGTSKQFSPEMSATPLNSHTSETVDLEVQIYKDSGYGQLLGKCQFSAEIYYIDKNQCSDFKEWTFNPKEPPEWTLNNLSVSNVADIDGSGYCLYGACSGWCDKICEVSKDLNCGEKIFLGFAVGCIVNGGGVPQHYVVVGSNKVNFNVPVNKWGYVVVGLHGATGTNNVKIHLEISSNYSGKYVKIYVDDIRYYVL